MIEVGMTIREMVALASNPSCNSDLYERIIKALETATGNAKMAVACNGVRHEGQFWDQKIAAIKALRNATGLGLKDAKEWIEDCQASYKTMLTGPLDPEVASQLKISLENCGCSCWVTSA